MLLARPAWIAVDLDAISHNIGEIQRRLRPQTGLLAVVKSHAYGHGAVPVAKTALAAGAVMLGVTCLDEALELRAAGITADVLMLGYAPGWQAPSIVANDIIVSAYEADLLEPLSSAAQALGRPGRVHLKVDTGMSRFGPRLEGVAALATRALRSPGVCVEGVFTHLATADAADERAAREQLARFDAVLRLLADLGCHPRWRHAANSAATFRFPESHFDLVRPGAALYGLDPSPATPCPAGFRPALSFRALVAQVKTIPPGTAVSYGGTWRAARPTRLAVLQAGYADGLRRSPDPWQTVLIHGQRAPIVGTICMDACMVDVTDVADVAEGDVAVFLGRQGTAEITVGEVASQLGTIGYEVLCALASRIPRVYLPAGASLPEATAVPLSGRPLRAGVETL